MFLAVKLFFKIFESSFVGKKPPEDIIVIDKLRESKDLISITFNEIKIKLIPLFHPAAIIYNRKLIVEWEKDMEVVKKETTSILD